ncbi:MAG: tRNA pseudouridine(55) synthase TruB [Candidatus Hydrogenedentes bacterium]|nr:tRNA pseudouridine(55) synthase TruB [Candidatus Hydrogenedentota bacterium]
MTGILLVDKPSGMTSHDVVDCIRHAARMKRIGHTGTLDPAATGLLILCLGHATRLSEFLTGLDKVYEGTMRFGIITDSYDLDGKVVEERPVPKITNEEIQEAFDGLSGEILQIPPMVSAVKVKGERLYKLARKGETIEREPRKITVREFALLGYAPPDAAFRVRCTRGTYARALAYDVGEKLGCGATLASLRRTAVGKHTIERAKPVDAFASPEDVAGSLLPVDDVLELPAVRVRKASRGAVIAGATLERPDLVEECSIDKGWVQVKSETGELLAMGEVHAIDGVVSIQPKRVLYGQ